MKKTKKERRIEVLKDAIKQIKLQKIIAISGEVVEINDPSLTSVFGENIDAKPKLEEFFKTKKEVKPCKACARGSLLLCTVHKENDFLLSDFNGCSGPFEPKSTTDKRLSTLFSDHQLVLMENAFEVDPGEMNEDDFGLNNDRLSRSLDKKSVNFGLKYEDPNKRLLAIFRNAVKNEGIFKP